MERENLKIPVNLDAILVVKSMDKLCLGLFMWNWNLSKLGIISLKEATACCCCCFMPLVLRSSLKVCDLLLKLQLESVKNVSLGRLFFSLWWSNSFSTRNWPNFAFSSPLFNLELIIYFLFKFCYFDYF